jgi:hypothetical protein
LGNERVSNREPRYGNGGEGVFAEGNELWRREEVFRVLDVAPRKIVLRAEMKALRAACNQRARVKAAAAD